MNRMEQPEKPPLFRSWTGWYVLLLVFLLVQIAFFAWITNYFS